MDYPKEMTAQQRAAVVTELLLCSGKQMRTVEVAERVGLTPRSARRLLNLLSAVTPIYPEDGVWQRIQS